MSGGTHLWRRGMTFDGSLAVSVFDERLTDGRPAEVAAFRRALVSGLSGAVPAEIATEVPSWSRLGDVSPTDPPRPVTPWNPCA